MGLNIHVNGSDVEGDMPYEQIITTTKLELHNLNMDGKKMRKTIVKVC